MANEVPAITPQSRTCEWLEPDGLGGFASGTVGGIRTRRYHALLLVAAHPPANRFVLVNGLDAELETSIGRFALSTQRYAPGINTPDGADRLVAFETEPWPRWTFHVPGGKVVQEIFVPKGRASVVLRWRWEGEGTAQLHVRPFFSGRDFHGTHHENPAFRFAPQITSTGERWSFYDGIPPVNARSNGIYNHEPGWYRNFLYDEEAARGLDAVEDLAAPGRYQFQLGAAPAVLIFTAEEISTPLSGAPISAAPLADKVAESERARRAAFANPRLRAADAYIVPRGTGKTIIAGYPWFGDWGRDTFISMRGLCLATGRLDDAKQILLAWASTVSEGMLPNRFPDKGDQPEYNSVDASLWYVVVVHEFLELSRETSGADAKTLLNAVEAILAGYLRGTRFGIRGDASGLLACGEPGVQLTWMDAKVGDHVVTPRTGKPVEVQALWLNALGLAAKRKSYWQPLFERGCASFRKRFWNESRGCLYDVVDVDHQPGACDASVRPNQIFAVGGLPLALLDEDLATRVVAVVEEKLWTPMGLRSLAPDEPGYAAHYEGLPAERDSVYHQGTVWPWLAGPFVEAWCRVHGNTDESCAQAREKFLAPRLLRSDLIGLDHVPEIADAEPPHTARGCPFQAWSLGEILRVGK